MINIYLIKVLQKTQEDEIARLEKEIEEKNFQHENRIRALKTKFLREQRSFEEQAEKKVTAMSEKADKVLEIYYIAMYINLSCWSRYIQSSLTTCIIVIIIVYCRELQNA